MNDLRRVRNAGFLLSLAALTIASACTPARRDLHVGPYAIVREIGRGGMGVVYLARDERLDRDVAVKAVPDDLAHDAGRMGRLAREAPATNRRFSRPNNRMQLTGPACWPSPGSQSAGRVTDPQRSCLKPRVP
jgi:serine/threonine protein kinase